MVRVRDLLASIGFSVDVFDEPSQNRADDEAKRRILAADCVVVLLGPHKAPDPSDASESITFAQFPAAEAHLAQNSSKPICIVLHQGISPPPFLSEQTWPHFDFWSSEEYAANVHHLVRRFLELKEGLELAPSSRRYEFKRAEIINRIKSEAELITIVIHEVIAREPCDKFGHSVDTARVETPEAELQIDDFRISQTSGDAKELKIIKTEVTPFEYNYNVVCSPKLRSNETIGYRRVFRQRNRFPLTRSSLSKQASQKGFPKPIFSYRFYGDAFDVSANMQSFRLAFYFPANVKIISYDAIVIDTETLDRNESLTDKARQGLKLTFDDIEDELVLELRVEKPSISHSYYLLYEPGDDE